MIKYRIEGLLRHPYKSSAAAVRNQNLYQIIEGNTQFI
jgi:hypothetical protein